MMEVARDMVSTRDKETFDGWDPRTRLKRLFGEMGSGGGGDLGDLTAELLRQAAAAVQLQGTAR